MTPSLGIEPGPHWWEASALITTPSLITRAPLISSWKRGWRKHKHKHRDQNFSFSLCLRLCLHSLASCENETQHKYKEICFVWRIKVHVPDSLRIWAFEQNGGCSGWIWRLCRRSFSLLATYACACACIASDNQALSLLHSIFSQIPWYSSFWFTEALHDTVPRANNLYCFSVKNLPERIALWDWENILLTKNKMVSTWNCAQDFQTSVYGLILAQIINIFLNLQKLKNWDVNDENRVELFLHEYGDWNKLLKDLRLC